MVREPAVLIGEAVKANAPPIRSETKTLMAFKERTMVANKCELMR